jgi:hypothetical protein
MFAELSEKLEATFAKLRGRGVLTEADIKEGLREVRRVLLEARASSSSGSRSAPSASHSSRRSLPPSSS